jgi:hypothetical protein
MASMTLTLAPVNQPPTMGTADGWPAWTDGEVWEPDADAPSADDAEWAAEQNTDHHSQDEESDSEADTISAWDAGFEDAGDEYAAIDSHSRGYCHA